MKIAICPGSFDPVTNGHLDIIRRAARLFDKVIVAVMTNTSKTPVFTQAERVELIRRCVSDIPNVEVEQFGGMVHEAQWPAFDPAKTKEDTVEIVLQVLGKVRSRMTISADTPKEEVLAAAKADSKIAALLEGKTIKKEIYVPGKLVNFVAI